MIYFRMSNGIMLTSIADKSITDLAESRDHDGCQANHVVCRRWQPYGATAWANSPHGPWLSLESCPLPLLPGVAQALASKPKMSKYGR